MNYFRKSRFPQCCGVDVVHNIEYSPTHFDGEKRVNNPSFQHMLKEITFTKKLDVNNPKSKDDIYYNNSLTLIVLNSYQREIYEQELLNFGYKVLIDGFFNNNSDDFLTMYVYERHEALSKKFKRKKHEANRIKGHVFTQST